MRSVVMSAPFASGEMDETGALKMTVAVSPAQGHCAGSDDSSSVDTSHPSEVSSQSENNRAAFTHPIIHGGTVASPVRSSKEDVSGLPNIISPQPLTHGLLQSSTEIDAHNQAVSTFKSSIRRSKILCIGAGYVGGPTMAVVAHKCPDLQVYVADVCEPRIATWNSSKLPIYEPGLEDLVKECRGRNLHFTTDVAGCIRDCDIIFVAVNTPTKQFGIGKGKAADISSCEAVTRSIAAHAKSSKIVIEKSTVPIRTAESLRRILRSNRLSDDINFTVLSNPEFLAEGTAVQDLLNPDRVLVGGNVECEMGIYAMEVVADIYRRWVDPAKVLTTNTWSSEMAKLVANAFLAQRVSSINSIAMLCEKTGADVREVARSIGADTRIGSKFLSASIGFGGSCLEKDTLSLAYLCDFFGLREAAQYWQMVNDMNSVQKTRFTQRIIHGLFDTVNRKQLAVFGFAFKKNTSDVRSTPALDICATLMADGAQLKIFDPKVELAEALKEFATHGTDRRVDINLSKQFNMVVSSSPILIVLPVMGASFSQNSAAEAVKDSHAIIVLTEWDEFKSYNYEKFFALMKKPAFIFDGRNLLDHKLLHSIGFEVHGVGVLPLKCRTAQLKC